MDEESKKRTEERIPSGYEGQNVPTDFYIPPSTIEDIDGALFNLFVTKIPFVVKVNNEPKKVPVIFASGERFAILQHKLPLRSRDGSNVLPMIAIKRTSINQTFEGRSRGLGQNTGDLAIRRRLSSEDRRYQQIINKLHIQNQDNVAVPVSSSIGADYLASRRSDVAGSLSMSSMDDELGNNIFEIITVPFPHFIMVTYEVMFWTQYTQDMNSMLEQFITAYDGQGNQFRIDSDKGYWYVAYVSDELTSQDNVDDFTDQERIVKYSFNIEVTGYLVANQSENQMNPFRRFLSAPQLSFGTIEVSNPVVVPFNGPISGDINKFTLSETEILDRRGEQVDPRGTGQERLVDVVQDPFTNESKTRYVRIVGRNSRRGETLYQGINIDELLK